ncbi:hypothetical protein CLV59_102430 [Chitinophaga dinghuensis]|uniref:Uncharacterized protein n=1 Tax=Chitinophaga dinghuensis TaxID=1539050 RepID=A0A327W5N9_9BACT|nr:DUF5522 domain-containing protein [Chitinophaga dinghuensis]RAJ85725.1 hypothetical protein CLV59_102430 [Chitinophaga dinghuensis]
MKQPLVENIDFYYNEQGYMVFTEKFHLDRGFCCGNGCRHCPYNFESVPEPKKSILLAKRQENKNTKGER